VPAVHPAVPVWQSAPGAERLVYSDAFGSGRSPSGTARLAPLPSLDGHLIICDWSRALLPLDHSAGEFKGDSC
jgi:hypothetical protein